MFPSYHMSILRAAFYLAAVAVAALCGVADVAEAAEEHVVFTQLLHRHGSRSPLPPVNRTRWCTAEGCGLLNKEGRHMLFRLGQHLRSRYAALGAEYFAEDGVYDASVVSSRSTDVLRTILSAEAFLAGLYPNASNPLAQLPLVAVTPYDTDELLSSNAVMAYGPRIPFLVMSGRLRRAMEPTVERLFGDYATNATTRALLDAMAEESHMQGYCAAEGFGVCLGYVHDVAVALISEGRTAEAPVSVANVGALTELLGDINRAFYGYFPSDSPLNPILGDTAEDVMARGTPGQPLAQEMIANAKAFIDGTMPYKVKHYSAHDTTITPFAVTIGEEGLFTTPYGTYVAIDLVEEGGEYFLRGVSGAPSQAPGDHTYTDAPLTLGGITAAGDRYASAERVPLADFARFVDSTKAKLPAGVDQSSERCFLNKALTTHMNCGLQKGSALSRECRTYRTMCPAFGCPAGSYLVYPSMECAAIPNGEESDGRRFGLGALIGAAAGALIGGLLAGYAASTVVRRRRYEALNPSCNNLVA